MEFFSDAESLKMAIAIENVNAKELEAILKSHPDVERRGKWELTQLGWSYIIRNKTAFEQLLRYGANPNAKVWNTMPLLHIVATDKRESYWLAMALKGGGDPNSDNGLKSIPYGEQTPVFSALRSRNPKNIELLVGAKANLNHRDHRGFTVMMSAAENNWFDSVLQLLEAGADYRGRDDNDRDLTYHIVVSNGTTANFFEERDKVIHFLEGKGIDFENVVTNIGDADVRSRWEADRKRRINVRNVNN